MSKETRMKFVESIIAWLCFSLLLLLIFFTHMRSFAVDVVFYSVLFDAALAAAIATAILFALGSRLRVTRFERGLLGCIFLLSGYAFAISVPTLIDRSLSFYLLEKLEQRGGGIRQDALASVFVDEYLIEHRLVDVRLTEQLQSGTIEIVEGCVLLTDKGRELAELSRWFRLQLLPKRRLLLDEYTDGLVDPFRESVARTYYACGR